MASRPVDSPTVFVHPTAIVEDGAVIGAGTKVWHHAHVRSGAAIGSDTQLGKNVYVDEGAVIGDRVKIQNNVSVYRGVTIGDEVLVGPSAVFTNELWPRARAGDFEVTPTAVGRGVAIGANATIICGVTLGEYATVGAGSVVTHDVEHHELVVGNPARHHGWVCDCGRLVSREVERPTDLRCGRCAQLPAG